MEKEQQTFQEPVSSISDHEKATQSMAYFNTFPTWTIWLTLIAIAVLVIVGIIDFQRSLKTFLIIGGVISIVVAIVAVVLSYSGRATNEEMTLWAEEEIVRQQKRAMAKMDINPSDLIKPSIVLAGYYQPNNGFFAEGNDGRVHYLPIDITILNFTKKQLLMYRVVAWIGGHIEKEQSDEIFYQDIVSVKTDSKKVGDFDDVPVYIFKLTTTGGTTINASLFNENIADNAVQTVRQILREIKQ